MSLKFVRDTRHKSLARSLHKRLYVNCTGRIFAVGEDVVRERLQLTIERYGSCPNLVNAPSPHDLGCTVCDGELSDEVLHAIGRALQRWRKDLKFEMQHRPARRRRKAQLIREREEIERLTARLALVRHWQTKLAAGHDLPGAPYFLDEVAEFELQQTLAEAASVSPVSALMAWQARIVYWLGGSCATRRFLTAFAGLLATRPGISDLEELGRFEKAIKVLKKRSELEEARHLRTELTVYLKRMPSPLVCRGNFTSKLRDRSFGEHCDLLLQRCAHLLAKLERCETNTIPAALAALAATDGSSAAIPIRYLEGGTEPNDTQQIVNKIKSLAEQIGQPGYDALLAALEQLEDYDQEIKIYQLREMLRKGNKLQEAIWACKQDLYFELEYSHVKIVELRRLSESFAKRGMPLSKYELGAFVHRMRKPEDLKHVRAWLAWFSAVSPQTITPRIRVSLRATFWDIFLPSLFVRDWSDQLVACLTLPRRSKDETDYTPFVERIRACQQLAGKQVTLPKTIRKLMHGEESRRLECEHLRERMAQGLLNDGARHRLEYLESATQRPVDGVKLRRTAEEVYLLFGTETLRAVSHRCAAATCRAHLGDLVEKFPTEQHLNLAISISRMRDAARNRLRVLVEMCARDSRQYKRHLAENQPWISKAVLRGLDLDPWFAADTQFATIGGVRVEMEVVSDLHYIFLMGTYFQTCLSLGSSNEMSVFANAYDANKQVVMMFAIDDRGGRRLIARKLIAISSEFELLGYCCYERHPCDERIKYHDVQAAMSAYCARLAAQCGMKLADRGQPEKIVDHFWYNDGEGEWSAEARSAWAESFVSAEVLESSAC